MEKYKAEFTKRVKPKQQEDSSYKVEPFRNSQEALMHAEFSSREREVFFNEAYGSILADLFTAWLRTEPHATKERDFLYASAMALGSVKAKMIGIETYGTNMQFIKQQTQVQEGTNDN
jgi:uncharacterized glyoxalase superfamily protein PhnB